jgi:quercetin dioxygenase-like cupin family protein
MNIKTEKLSTDILVGKPEGYVNRSDVMPHEIEGVHIEYISVKGPRRVREMPGPDHYCVLLSLSGNAKLDIRGNEHSIHGSFIIKIPYDSKYGVRVEAGQEFNCLIIRKSLDDKDKQVIAKDKENQRVLYLRELSDCPTYTEDIKSKKTVNRMILPEGLVPRFCMGSVETEGPDEVAEHEHPNLDQLFFGLSACNCTCYADNEKAVLTENSLLHIPLGSKHSVMVEDGEKLSYIWFDFFLTLEGQKYMNEQHLLQKEKKNY